MPVFRIHLPDGLPCRPTPTRRGRQPSGSDGCSILIPRSIPNNNSLGPLPPNAAKGQRHTSARRASAALLEKKTLDLTFGSQWLVSSVAARKTSCGRTSSHASERERLGANIRDLT